MVAPAAPRHVALVDEAPTRVQLREALAPLGEQRVVHDVGRRALHLKVGLGSGKQRIIHDVGHGALDLRMPQPALCMPQHQSHHSHC